MEKNCVNLTKFYVVGHQNPPDIGLYQKKNVMLNLSFVTFSLTNFLTKKRGRKKQLCKN